jgi:hypothetical protein
VTQRRLVESAWGTGNAAGLKARCRTRANDSERATRSE